MANFFFGIVYVHVHVIYGLSWTVSKEPPTFFFLGGGGVGKMVGSSYTTADFWSTFRIPDAGLYPKEGEAPLRLGLPRIAILGIWGDTWLTRGKYGIYGAVRGSYGALTGST